MEDKRSERRAIDVEKVFLSDASGMVEIQCETADVSIHGMRLAIDMDEPDAALVKAGAQVMFQLYGESASGTPPMHGAEVRHVEEMDGILYAGCHIDDPAYEAYVGRYMRDHPDLVAGI